VRKLTVAEIQIHLS